MKIGIDIDDTICDTWEYVRPFFCKYFNLDENLIRKSNLAYEDVLGISIEKYYDFARKYYPSNIKNAKIKDGVVAVLNKLKEE